MALRDGSSGDPSAPLGTWARWGRAATQAAIVMLALLPSLLRMDTALVIMTAQVVNGCLLPIVASLLFLCINDARFMHAAPQSMALNVLLGPCCAVCLFIAVFFFITSAGTSAAAALGAAAGVAALLQALLVGVVWRRRREGGGGVPLRAHQGQKQTELARARELVFGDGAL